MASIKKAYADTPHGQIHYRHARSPHTSPSKPILIFLHKSASSSISMEPLMTHYSTLGHTTYAPDMPGFGGSFDPSPSVEKSISEQGTRWYCDLYVQFFKELDIWDEKRGVHLLGHHSGATLSIELANLYPEVVRSACLVGPSTMSTAQQTEMREKLLHAFNEPNVSGSHLLATWTYLGRNGVTASSISSEPPTSCSDEDLALWQREAIDHIRAWKGRLQIYGAVFTQKTEEVMAGTKVPVMVCCARDDVLWPYFENAKKAKSDVVEVEVKGSNFSVDRDVDGIVEAWTPFIEKASQ